MSKGSTTLSTAFEWIISAFLYSPTIAFWLVFGVMLSEAKSSDEISNVDIVYGPWLLGLWFGSLIFAVFSAILWSGDKSRALLTATLVNFGNAILWAAIFMVVGPG